MASALSALKALARKEAAPKDSPASKLAKNSNDPAIAGAKRERNTVTLGVDPAVEEDARLCANLYHALKDAKAQYSVQQQKLRDYGSEKREKYNEAFKCEVTTINVPFMEEVPTGSEDESDTPGREQRVVQVICSNKYSVQQDTILGLEEDLGDFFDLLFEKEESKVLKPNAEELLRQLFEEMGLKGDDLENSMAVLFEEEVKVKAKKDYENQVKKVPEDVRPVLDQAVVRQQPGIKVP